MSAQMLTSAPEGVPLHTAAPDILDAENAILGVLLCEPERVPEVARLLSPQDFYGAEFDASPNARIFAQMVADASNGTASEPRALAMQLSDVLADLGGSGYLGDLIAKAPPGAGLSSLVKQIAASACQRRIMRALARPGLTAAEVSLVLRTEGERADELAINARPVRATPFKWREPQAIPRREWLYDLHLIRRFISATFAPGAVGKTMLLIVEALAMVTGRPLLGAKPREPLTVWLINLEDPREELERRVAAACLFYGITESEIGGRLYLDSGREAPVTIAKMGKHGVEVCAPCVRAIERDMTRRGIDVLIVDPFVACHEVEENSNPAINVVAKQWAGLADRTGSAIELVHHVRKSGVGQTETTVEDGRGAGALLAAVRSARVLNSMTDQQATEWGIEERRFYFRVDNGKANLAPPASRAKWRKLEDVDLENGPVGLSDRVGVPALWEPPATLNGITPADLFAVQKLVSEGVYKASEQANDWAGNAVAEVMGWNVLEKRDRARIKSVLNSWLKSGALKIDRRKDPKKREEKPYVIVGEWVQL